MISLSFNISSGIWFKREDFTTRRFEEELGTFLVGTDAETVAAQAEAEAKEMAKAEEVYRQLEAKFREELGIDDETADPSEVKVDVADTQ